MSIPSSKLRAVKTVITHDSCSDGLASAMILKDCLRDEVEIRFLNHNTKALEELKATPNMLFCDFTPPVDRAEEFRAAGALVLDHHKDKKTLVLSFGEDGVFADELLDPGISGATLAFKEVWLPIFESSYLDQRKFVGRFAELVGIRDTWQRHSPDWEEACVLHHALQFFPKESWLTDDPFRFSNDQHDSFWRERNDIGEMLIEREKAATNGVIKDAYRFTTKNGYKCIMFSGSRFTSDVAEALDGHVDLVIGFAYYASGLTDETWAAGESKLKLQVSTRSHGVIDVSALAQSFPGGGGHTNAAGFSLWLEVGDPNPFTQIERAIRAYLEK